MVCVNLDFGRYVYIYMFGLRCNLSAQNAVDTYLCKNLFSWNNFPIASLKFLEDLVTGSLNSRYKRFSLYEKTGKKKDRKITILADKQSSKGVIGRKAYQISPVIRFNQSKDKTFFWNCFPSFLVFFYFSNKTWRSFPPEQSSFCLHILAKFVTIFQNYS